MTFAIAVDIQDDTGRVAALAGGFAALEKEVACPLNPGLEVTPLSFDLSSYAVCQPTSRSSTLLPDWPVVAFCTKLEVRIVQESKCTATNGQKQQTQQ